MNFLFINLKDFRKMQADENFSTQEFFKSLRSESIMLILGCESPDKEDFSDVERPGNRCLVGGFEIPFITRNNGNRSTRHLSAINAKISQLHLDIFEDNCIHILNYEDGTQEGEHITWYGGNLRGQRSYTGSKLETLKKLVSNINLIALQVAGKLPPPEVQPPESVEPQFIIVKEMIPSESPTTHWSTLLLFAFSILFLVGGLLMVQSVLVIAPPLELSLIVWTASVALISLAIGYCVTRTCCSVEKNTYQPVPQADIEFDSLVDEVASPVPSPERLPQSFAPLPSVQTTMPEHQSVGRHDDDPALKPSKVNHESDQESSAAESDDEEAAQGNRQSTPTLT